MGCWRGYLSGARCRLAYGPADATATHCLLLQQNPDWFYLSGTSSPIKWACVCVCVWSVVCRAGSWVCGLCPAVCVCGLWCVGLVARSSSSGLSGGVGGCSSESTGGGSVSMSSCVMVSRADGSCRSFHSSTASPLTADDAAHDDDAAAGDDDQVSLLGHAVCLDPLHNTLYRCSPHVCVCVCVCVCLCVPLQVYLCKFHKAALSQLCLKICISLVVLRT